MRELYAVELRAESAASERVRIEGFIRQWASNPFEDLEPDAFVTDGTIETDTGSITTATVDEGWTLRWNAWNDMDHSLVWHTDCAVGTIAADLLVTVRIGIGQSSGKPAALGPIEYEFKAPTIIRTVLRELIITDSGWAVEPQEKLVGASAVTDLVHFLCGPSRRLPVVILTGTAETGAPVQSAREIAKQLAGLAHVVVLTSGLACRNLTDEVGQERSVWLGAARIYWPGFTKDASRTNHKLWDARRMAQSRLPLADELRRWLGSVSAARTPEHPAMLAARHALGGAVEDLPDWAKDYLDHIEEDNAELTQDRKAAQADLADRDRRIMDLEAHVAQLKESFAAVSTASSLPIEPEAEANLPITSVRDAVDAAIASAGNRIVFLEKARRSGYEFTEYQDPAKLHRALLDVAEASELYGLGGFGTTLKEWFRERGYEYSARNDNARDRRYEHHYKVRYQDELVVMEPHLKVDQSTGPDQCLRIYWYIDDAERTFVVGHVGRHLPPT